MRFFRQSNFKRRNEPEFDEQVNFVQYVLLKHPGILFTASTQGIKLTKSQGARFKLMGYTPGTPDLSFFRPSGGFHGLFVEMKSLEGRQSEDQKKFQERAEKEGYKYALCKGFDQAVSELEKYLKGSAI